MFDVVSFDCLDRYPINSDFLSRLDGFDASANSRRTVLWSDHNGVFLAKLCDFGRTTMVTVIVRDQYDIRLVRDFNHLSVLLQVNVNDFVFGGDLEAGMPKPLNIDHHRGTDLQYELASAYKT
jgi:hypothetical protein